MQEYKALQVEVDEEKKNKEVTIDTLENLDKQITRINEKRKKNSDEIDKLRK